MNKYKETLNKIRKIRNKYEHKIHDVKYQSSGIDTNILFSKIAQEISIFSYQKGKAGYAYYERISRFDFKDFNEIYESDILRKIGKVMNKF